MVGAELYMKQWFGVLFSLAQDKHYAWIIFRGMAVI